MPCIQPRCGDMKQIRVSGGVLTVAGLCSNHSVVISCGEGSEW